MMEAGGAILEMPQGKRKGAGRPKAVVPVHPIASVKGTDELETWLDGLVDKSNLKTRTLVIWHALKVYAESLGYNDPIPKR